MYAPATSASYPIAVLPSHQAAFQPRRGLGDGLTLDGTGLFGTGLFSGGFDVQNWTWAEWSVVGLGGFLAFKAFSGSKGGSLFGSKSGRRKKLELAKAQYELQRAEA